ncbi:hypothetical protein Csa_017081 [Cucumis sativus]|nr:hypothetical protein Csa_017081 [Cucumis sativus]
MAANAHIKMTIGIGGGIGIGIGVPGIKVSIGGGIGIGSRKGGCKSHDPSKKWSQVPNAQADQVIINVANFAVAAFNQKYGNKLVFHAVLEAWVVVLPDGKKEYSIELVAKDCLNRCLYFHAIVIEIVGVPPGWNLFSFTQISD